MSPRLAVFREIGDQRDASRSLNNLGNVANDIGDFPKAMKYYEQTLAIDRETGSKSGVAGAPRKYGECSRQA